MAGACLGVLQHSQGRLLTMLPRSSTLQAMGEQSVSTVKAGAHIAASSAPTTIQCKMQPFGIAA